MKPLILDFKTTRVDPGASPCYQYDPIESLNTVSLNGRNIPFIDTTANDIEFLTRTRVMGEKDDASLLFDLTTKTKVVNERDDHQTDHVILSTKTLVKTESDDTRTPYY